MGIHGIQIDKRANNNFQIGVGSKNHQLLSGGFKYFLFSSLFGKDSHLD